MVYLPQTAFPVIETTVSHRLRVFAGECPSGTGWPGCNRLQGEIQTPERDHGARKGRIEGKSWAPKNQRPVWPFCYFACGLRVAISMCHKEIISCANLGTHMWVVQAHGGPCSPAKVGGAGKYTP